MRFRCTAKVERHSPDSSGAQDVFHVRVGCLPLHEPAKGDPFRAVNVVVSARGAGNEWRGLQRDVQHRRIESLVRSYVKKRGVQWVHSWLPDVIERIDLTEHPLDLAHDDPGDPFEIAIA
jgi:hypothetical protein